MPISHGLINKCKMYIKQQGKDGSKLTHLGYDTSSVEKSCYLNPGVYSVCMSCFFSALSAFLADAVVVRFRTQWILGRYVLSGRYRDKYVWPQTLWSTCWTALSFTCFLGSGYSMPRNRYHWWMARLKSYKCEVLQMSHAYLILTLWGFLYI